MPGDHRSARGAVIDEHAGPRRLPAQHDLLARVDQRQRTATERARCGMEIDVVRHRVGGRVDQGQLDIVALVHDHQRSGHRAVEGHGLEGGALLVDHHLLFLDHELELHDLRALLGRLFVRMHERRGDQVDLLARQLEVFGNSGSRKHHRGDGCTEHGGAAGQHGSLLRLDLLWAAISMRLLEPDLFVLQQAT